MNFPDFHRSRTGSQQRLHEIDPSSEHPEARFAPHSVPEPEISLPRMFLQCVGSWELVQPWAKFVGLLSFSLGVSKGYRHAVPNSNIHDQNLMSIIIVSSWYKRVDVLTIGFWKTITAHRSSAFDCALSRPVACITPNLVRSRETACTSIKPRTKLR
ncbi:hypothetical protein K504DRAFT_500258 [Pleomassaria siparia CBS 279.74]|uniref:Uncharacterized protein n=1 Tax=Pleomassaria siparia CBS 279.74 TaxID=1314801 RepID=A0A6G1KFJ1_9PLEO|nr:hypothetical protein K504DRAFT_500258 [Pleomassaria siparia CBS 279.74]